MFISFPNLDGTWLNLSSVSFLGTSQKVAGGTLLTLKVLYPYGCFLPNPLHVVKWKASSV